MASTYWNNGYIDWPQGVQATFPTRDGDLYGTHVNSIVIVNAYSPDGTWLNFVEVGWFRDPGRNRFQTFGVTEPNGVGSYVELPGNSFVGEATATYNVFKTVTGPHDTPVWQFTVLLGGNTFWTTNAGSNGSWWTGLPITNAERHDYRDTWSNFPDFTSLWVESSSPHWSLWPNAICQWDFDPNYAQQIYTNPIEVLVFSQTGNSC